jgi:uncharacterized membrane protein YhiD involved in acid resistance
MAGAPFVGPAGKLLDKALDAAGVRTQSIVGTAAALIMLISKYGSFDGWTASRNG